MFCKYSQENKMPSVHSAADEFPSDPQRDVIPVSIKHPLFPRLLPHFGQDCLNPKNRWSRPCSAGASKLGTTA